MLSMINVFPAFDSLLARLHLAIFPALLLGALIIVLVALGAVRYVWRYADLRWRGGRRTGGKVVGHEYIHNEKTGRYYYHAVIEFSTVEAHNPLCERRWSGRARAAGGRAGSIDV